MQCKNAYFFETMMQCFDTITEFIQVTIFISLT